MLRTNGRLRAKGKRLSFLGGSLTKISTAILDTMLAMDMSPPSSRSRCTNTKLALVTATAGLARVVRPFTLAGRAT